MLRQPADPTFRFVAEHRGDCPASWACDASEVSESGYHAWASRPDRPAEQRQQELAEPIEVTHPEVEGRYGGPRVTAGGNARGHDRSEDTVAKLMRPHGIRAKAPRRLVRTTDSRHGLPVAPDVLDRELDPDGPNAAWAADVTYIPTAGGWLYPAVVEGLFSRMIVGWGMDQTVGSRLVVDAPGVAVRRRVPGGGPVAHSDRGSPYARGRYRRVLGRHGIACSMTRVAQCRGNAPVESLFASLKREPVHDERYTTRGQARASTLGYVEAFYNRVRRHSSPGYLSPAESERAHNPKRPELRPHFSWGRPLSGVPGGTWDIPLLGA